MITSFLPPLPPQVEITVRGWEPIGASIEREKYRSGGSLSLFQSCPLREMLLGGIVLDPLSTWEEEEIEEGATVSLQFGERTLEGHSSNCLLYTSPSPRDATLSRMPSSA